MSVTRKRHPWRLILVLVAFLASNLGFVGFEEYKAVFDDKQFLMESLFQVLETDFDEDQRPEMVVAGKNYVGRELLVYWVTVDDDFQPVLKWQSPNLFEERSILWIATGRFNHWGNVLLVATNTKYYWFKFENDALQLVQETEHGLEPLNVVAGDVDGDGLDELIVARIGEITITTYLGYVEVWKWSDGTLKLMGRTGLLGNIRGLTVGDLEGDGKAEIIVEEGLKLDSGKIHVLSHHGDQLVEIHQTAGVGGAAYSLKVKQFGDERRLMTASTRGKINFFSWRDGKLKRDDEELSFTSELVDAEGIDLDNDGVLELCVIGYSQRLIVLKR